MRFRNRKSFLSCFNFELEDKNVEKKFLERLKYSSGISLSKFTSLNYNYHSIKK